MNCVLRYGWGCTENATSAAMRTLPETVMSGSDAISKVKGVQKVAFCAVPKGDGFYTPVCFIVPEDHTEKEIVRSKVAQFCHDHFGEDMQPAHIYLRDCLPLTRVGKPDVRALKAEATQMENERRYTHD